MLLTVAYGGDKNSSYHGSQLIYHMTLYRVVPDTASSVSCYVSRYSQDKRVVVQNVLPAFYGAVWAVCADQWRSVAGRACEAASVAWRLLRPENPQMKVEASEPMEQMESELITTTKDKKSQQSVVVLSFKCCHLPICIFYPTLLNPATGDPTNSRV